MLTSFIYDRAAEKKPSVPAPVKSEPELTEYSANFKPFPIKPEVQYIHCILREVVTFNVAELAALLFVSDLMTDCRLEPPR